MLISRFISLCRSPGVKIYWTIKYRYSLISQEYNNKNLGHLLQLFFLNSKDENRIAGYKSSRARLECGRSCVWAPIGSNQRL